MQPSNTTVLTVSPAYCHVLEKWPTSSTECPPPNKMLSEPSIAVASSYVLPRTLYYRAVSSKTLLPMKLVNELKGI